MRAAVPHQLLFLNLPILHFVPGYHPLQIASTSRLLKAGENVHEASLRLQISMNYKTNQSPFSKPEARAYRCIEQNQLTFLMSEISRGILAVWRLGLR